MVATDLKFDWKKFINGFNLFDGEKRGKLLYYGILITIGGFIMWSAFIKPTRHDLQTVSQRMDFHGARIDNLTLTTTKENGRSASRWSVGVYAETRTNDWQDATYGVRLDYHL